MRHSYHCGTTEDGKNFSQWLGDDQYEDMILEPFDNYLHEVFCESDMHNAIQTCAYMTPTASTSRTPSVTPNFSMKGTSASTIEANKNSQNQEGSKGPEKRTMDTDGSTSSGANKEECSMAIEDKSSAERDIHADKSDQEDKTETEPQSMLTQPDYLCTQDGNIARNKELLKQLGLDGDTLGAKKKTETKTSKKGKEKVDPGV